MNFFGEEQFLKNEVDDLILLEHASFGPLLPGFEFFQKVFCVAYQVLHQYLYD